MEAFLVSTGVVALAEIGDKTQLLAFILAAKFRKPVPIILGILIATLINHGFAGALGSFITSLVGPGSLRWILGLSFIAMAGWTLIPDTFNEKDAHLALRFNADKPSVMEVTDTMHDGARISYRLLSLPLYLIDHAHRLIDET